MWITPYFQNPFLGAEVTFGKLRSRSTSLAVAATAVAVAACAATPSRASLPTAAPLSAPGAAADGSAASAQGPLSGLPSVLDLATASTLAGVTTDDLYADPAWTKIVLDASQFSEQLVDAPIQDAYASGEPLQPDTQLDSGVDPARLNERLTGVLAGARTLIGRPYVWGGTTPRGFDCSGFTSFLYRQFAIQIPRTAEEQFHAVNKIDRSQARPGDLVFFPRSDGFVYHVAVYAGNGMIVEARNPRVGVLLDPIWASNVTFGTVRSEGHRPGGYVTGRYNPAPVGTGVGFSIGSWNGSAPGTSEWTWIPAPPNGGLPKQPSRPTPSASPSPTVTPTQTSSPSATPKPTGTPTVTPSPTATTTPSTSPSPSPSGEQTPSPTPSTTTAAPEPSPTQPSTSSPSVTADPSSPTAQSQSSPEPTAQASASAPTTTTAKVAQTTATGPSSPAPTGAPTPTETTPAATDPNATTTGG